MSEVLTTKERSNDICSTCGNFLSNCRCKNTETTTSTDQDTVSEINPNDEFSDIQKDIDDWDAMPYEKRFKLQDDEFARERITALKESFSDLQSQKPEVAGLSFFGSLTKGRARDSSDIDAWIFLNIDKLQENAVTKRIRERQDEISTNYKLDDEVANSYSGQIQWQLMEKLGLKYEQVEHIRALPINETIIDDTVDIIEQDIKDAEQYHNDTDEYYKKRGDFLANGEEPPEDLQAPIRKIRTIPQSVPELFHLQIGHGLDKYRAHTIRRIIEKGPMGEEIWRQLASLASVLETRAAKFKFPYQLDHAARIYLPEYRNNSSIEHSSNEEHDNT